MSTTPPDVDAALVAAAQVLPAHFADADNLTIEVLDPIQATTMSLPGGAYAVESVLKGAPANVGSAILVVTGLVDHKQGEIFSRDEARTVWTAALTECLSALQGSLGEFTPGQLHMTDAFDALEKADESNVVGVFSGQTLAGMLLTLPAKATGEGAAAQLAAAVAAATAEAEGGTDDADGTDGGEGAEAAEGADGDATGDAAQVGGDAAAAADAAAAGVAGGGGAPLTAAQQAALAAQAQAAAEARAADQAQLQAGMAPAQFQPFSGGLSFSVDPRRIELLRDVVMGVSVELGRTRMSVQEILGLTPGSIIELDRAAGAPVDVLVNGTLIAHGEVVVVDEEFAVRISEVVTPDIEGRVIA